MSGQWKLGDVAMVTIPGRGDVRAMYVDGGQWETPWAESDGITTYDAAPDFRRGYVGRPLIVLDPADGYANREQVWRFLDSLARNWHQATDDFKLFGGTGILCWLCGQFASPTPPKPDEPTGLGAVVEDASGQRWVAIAEPSVTTGAWVLRGTVGPARLWRNLAAVRVLSEGVTE